MDCASDASSTVSSSYFNFWMLDCLKGILCMLCMLCIQKPQPPLISLTDEQQLKCLLKTISEREPSENELLMIKLLLPGIQVSADTLENIDFIIKFMPFIYHVISHFVLYDCDFFFCTQPIRLWFPRKPKSL